MSQDGINVKPESGQMVWVPPGYEIAADQPSQEHSLHLWDYLWLLWHRRWLIGLTFTFCTLLTVLAMLQATPIYEGVAKIKIQPESNKVLTFEDIAAAGVAGQRTDFIETQLQIIQSRTLASQVVDQLDLYSAEEEEEEEPGPVARLRVALGDLLDSIRPESEPLSADEIAERKRYQRLSRFSSSLTVSRERDTEIVLLKFRDPGAARSAEVVDALCESYLRFNYQTKLKSYENAESWIDQKLLDVRGKLEKTEEDLLKFADGIDVVALSDNLSQYMEQYQETGQELAAAQQILTGKRFQADAFNKGEYPEKEIDDARYQELLTKLADAEVKYAQANEEFGPEMTEVRTLAAACESLRAAMADEEKRLSDKQAEQRRRDKESIAFELGQAEALVAFLAKSYADQETRLVDTQKRLIQYNIIKREVDVYEGLHNSLLERSREVSVVSGMEPSNVVVVEWAEKPLSPALPNKKRNVLLGAFLGLFFGIGLAFFLEYMNTSVKTAEEVERLTQIAVLGFVPHYQPPHRGRRKAERIQIERISHEIPKSVIAENFRFLRTAIQYSFAGHAPKTILVTSAMPSEGKTTTATNLAITLAQRGHRTLLIDADLKKPSIHHLFNIAEGQGLSEMLTGRFDDACVSPTDITDLDVLASGTRPPNPVDLLDSDVMRDLLVTFAEQYEHIVIDSAPSFELADTSVLAPYVDGIVLVVRPGSTPRDAVVRVKEKLAGVGGRFLGVVLNNPPQNSSRQYGYGYGYGYEYGYARAYGDMDEDDSDNKAV